MRPKPESFTSSAKTHHRGDRTSRRSKRAMASSEWGVHPPFSNETVITNDNNNNVLFRTVVHQETCMHSMQLNIYIKKKIIQHGEW